MDEFDEMIGATTEIPSIFLFSTSHPTVGVHQKVPVSSQHEDLNVTRNMTSKAFVGTTGSGVYDLVP